MTKRSTNVSTVLSLNVIPVQLAEDLVLVWQKGECNVDARAVFIFSCL